MPDAASLHRRLAELHREIAAVHAELGGDDADADSARAWYIVHVERHVAAGTRSSREADYRAARKVGLRVTHETIRRLREQVAPASWREPGRPAQLALARGE